MNQTQQPVTRIAPARAPRIVTAAPPAKGKRLRWLAATPAAIALVSGLAGVALLAARSPQQDISWYEGEAESAITAHNFPLAAVCYQRLLQYHPGDARDEFGLAVSLAMTGRQTEAIQLLNHLAPLDGPGYLPAHVFIAQQILAQKAAKPELMQVAETHLRLAATLEPRNPFIHGLLATLYARQRKWDLCRQEVAASGPYQEQLQRQLLPTDPGAGPAAH